VAPESMTPARRSAVKAILEGHADFVTARVADRLGIASVWERFQRARQRATWAPTDDAAIAPYVRGLQMVTHAFESNGDAGVRDLLRRPHVK